MQNRHLQMELVRLTNELARRDAYERFLENEVKNVKEETCSEYIQKIEFLEASLNNVARERNEYKQKAEQAGEKLAESELRNKELQARLDSLEDVREIADEIRKANIDAKDVVKVFQRRDFQCNSDV